MTISKMIVVQRPPKIAVLQDQLFVVQDFNIGLFLDLEQSLACYWQLSHMPQKDIKLDSPFFYEHGSNRVLCGTSEEIARTHTEGDVMRLLLQFVQQEFYKVQVLKIETHKRVIGYRSALSH